MREIKLTDQEVKDLTNGLDCLRQVYAEPQFTREVLDQYIGQEQRALNGRWPLYLKLEALRKK